MYGLEMHLVNCHNLIQRFHPDVVVLDPMGSFTLTGSDMDTTAMLTRLMDYLKAEGITALWTGLTTSGMDREPSAVRVSSLVDTWLVLENVAAGSERRRAMYVLKSRGMPHSNEIREYHMSKRGIELAGAYAGDGR
jgi:circadian clock protein KaiC